MDIFSMISSWPFVIIISTLMTYEDKKDNVKLASKRSYCYIATDAIMRIFILSVVMKFTMEFVLEIFN
ncbi:hypothetical protein BHU61_03080 [Macrococcus epidermidis]|uniref:Uncharacterized protein n=2 Tax=Macrococcus epidermidis TaxID=1902580 RepID=A0A327ZVR6_9STAP|nr:hypothetical protein BHU61_03080 [Macrococcus epidermidis]